MFKTKAYYMSCICTSPCQKRQLMQTQVYDRYNKAQNIIIYIANVEASGRIRKNRNS